MWRTVQEFTDRLGADGLRTYLGTCAEAADLLEAKGPLYRHIVVDEAQDLHPAQWRLLRAAAPARPDDLFIADDPHQRIYDTKVSLRALGIKVAGCSTKMRKNYRSTHEILTWSTALLVGRPFEQLEDDARNETLLGYRSVLHGNGPELYAATSQENEFDALVDRVRAWTENGVVHGEMGVTTRFDKGVEKALATLASAGIPALMLRADASGATDAVRFGTMHSFKGLAFRCVAVTGVNAENLPAPEAVTPVEADRLQHERT